VNGFTVTSQFDTKGFEKVVQYNENEANQFFAQCPQSSSALTLKAIPWSVPAFEYLSSAMNLFTNSVVTASADV
jgi:hypothetical protein